jgi:uncharacterized membrane protein YhhN
MYMNFTLLALALIFAVIDWFAVEKKWKSIEYVFKPAVMIVMIIWLLQNGGFSDWMIWFVFGAVFSLTGDIFLMLSQNFFLAGLISFLLAHISYIAGINTSFPPVTTVGVIIFLLFMVIAWQLYIRLAAGMDSKEMHRLKIPVLIYVIIISLMTLSAVITFFRKDWSISSAALISGGAMLFYISDSILAWDRFVSPISHGRLKTMVTYHLAQAGILIGAATNFSR